MAPCSERARTHQPAGRRGARGAVASDGWRQTCSRSCCDRPTTDGWARATAVEAYVALGETSWTRSGASRRSCRSRTRRLRAQLAAAPAVDVWRLDTEAPPGATLLPLLRSELLRKSGGVVLVEPTTLRTSGSRGCRHQASRRCWGPDQLPDPGWYLKGSTVPGRRPHRDRERGRPRHRLPRAGPDLHPSLPRRRPRDERSRRARGLDPDAAVVAFHAATGGVAGRNGSGSRVGGGTTPRTRLTSTPRSSSSTALPADVTPRPSRRAGPAWAPQ